MGNNNSSETSKLQEQQRLQKQFFDEIREKKIIAFVDLQGFLDNNCQFIVKEFSYTFAYSQIKPKHFIFKPPYEWAQLNQTAKQSAKYLARFHHGLQWRDGQLNYEHVRTCLNLMRFDNDIDVIYVKGAEKIKWLHELCPALKVPIYDVYFMPSLNNLEFKRKAKQRHCMVHDSTFNYERAYDCKSLQNHPRQCALQNVLILKDYYLKNYKEFYDVVD